MGDKEWPSYFVRLFEIVQGNDYFEKAEKLINDCQYSDNLQKATMYMLKARLNNNFTIEQWKVFFRETLNVFLDTKLKNIQQTINKCNTISDKYDCNNLVWVLYYCIKERHINDIE